MLTGRIGLLCDESHTMGEVIPNGGSISDNEELGWPGVRVVPSLFSTHASTIGIIDVLCDLAHSVREQNR
jgi:hypothetical protein